MVSMLSSIPHEHTDPWILLAPSDTDTYGEQFPLSLTELAYQAIQSASSSPITLATTNSTTAPPITAPSFDPLNQFLPTDEAIREIMSWEERPWKDSPHYVSIPDSDMIPLQILSPNILEIISSQYMTIQTLDSEGNMWNISKTLLIDISIMIGIVENIQIGASHNYEEIVSFTFPFKDLCNVFPWFYEEMHDVDPPIVNHEI